MKLHIVSPKDEIVENFSKNEFFQKEEQQDSVLVFVKKRKYFVLLETRREFTINFKLVHAGNGMRKLNENLFDIYDKNPSNVKIASKIVEKDQNLSRVQNFFAFQFVSTSETFAGYNSTFKFIFTFTDDNTEVESQEFRVISRCMNSNKLISREAKNYNSSSQQAQQASNNAIPSKKRSPQIFHQENVAMALSEKDDDIETATPSSGASFAPAIENGISAKKLKLAVNPSVQTQQAQVPQLGQELAPNNLVSYQVAQPTQAPQLDVLVQLQQMLGTLIAQQQIQQQHAYFPQQQNVAAFQHQLQHVQLQLQQQQQTQLQQQFVYAAPAVVPQPATQYIVMPAQQAMYVQEPMVAAPSFDSLKQPLLSSDAPFPLGDNDMENFLFDELSMA